MSKRERLEEFPKAIISTAVEVRQVGA